jgi:hypothetical protein
MLLSIGNVRSTTRLKFNWTGAWANATDAVPNARESKTSIRAFIMIVLLTVLATVADRLNISDEEDFVRHTGRSIGAMSVLGLGCVLRSKGQTKKTYYEQMSSVIPQIADVPSDHAIL